MPEDGGSSPVPSPPLGAIVRVEAWALRAPIAEAVVTSFGRMTDRPAVFARITGGDGIEGWGELWCNFPGVGAEHRARLLIDSVAPLVIGRPWPDIAALYRHLGRGLRVLAIQSGEPGPLAQACAGIDLAAWDLAARRRDLPLWRLLGGSDPTLRVYASGIHPHGAVETALRLRETGHRAFKLKVGFDAATDRASLAGLRDALGEEARLMVDANQAWTPAMATERIRELARFYPEWVEEPIAADHPIEAWARLARESPVPLAAGENLRGEETFDALLASGAVRYVQPDLGKWGGLTGCMAVARAAQRRGLVYCPHWLGGPIGLVASMHARAALGPHGYVEWDANPNPVHDRLATQLPRVEDGQATLSEAAGTGLDLSADLFEDLVTWRGIAG